jgi:MoaA/NifB/PqqE/SkfB family radical SAM enzyme
METSIISEDTIAREEIKIDNEVSASLSIGVVRSKMILIIKKLHMLLIAFRIFKNPIVVVQSLRKVDRLITSYLGGEPIRKLKKVAGRYYWDMYGASWPSPTFTEHVEEELKRSVAKDEKTTALRSVLLAITTHCPLKCDHCYEWDNLNRKEKLSLDDLKSIVAKFQSRSVCQIHFGGGEPMTRYKDILEIVRTSKRTTDFWLATSGYNLTLDRALALKESGLTGVSISLDHYRESKHNEFRKYEKAFFWAQQAAQNSKKAGLVVALSLCATRDFTTRINLKSYANLALMWGASFIQIIEPKAVGHYAGKDVSLWKEQRELLHEFFLAMNNESSNRKYPIVIYHEPYLKTLGCFGAGNRYLYVDPFANIHACPFCREACGNMTDDSFSKNLDELAHKGCHSYVNAKN